MLKIGLMLALSLVALRKESVDRNDFPIVPVELTTLVALRKESVDRNKDDLEPSSTRKLSLSARRAWIEIPFCFLWC